MSDQDVFNKILEERGEVDITPTSSTITVKVQSDLVAETVDTDGNPLRGPLYAMASTIRNQYASTDVKPVTRIEDGVRRTSYTFQGTAEAEALLDTVIAGKPLRELIVALGGFIIKK